jgi:hypothetical protein
MEITSGSRADNDIFHSHGLGSHRAKPTIAVTAWSCALKFLCRSTRLEGILDQKARQA